MNSGFVDLQVNGYRGIDFSAPGLTLDAVRHVTRQLLGAGTVAYCPTLVTADPAVYVANLPVLAQALREPDLGPHLLGIHMEGPFLAPAARGAHPERWLRDPDGSLFARWQELAAGQIRILTVAPELPGAEALIRQAAAQGVLVSLGHHMADEAAIAAAVQAGARASTHLGNGIPGLLPRHPNPIWTQLACDGLIGMFIADGHHLPATFVRAALRAKTVDRFVVVSDAAAIAGLAPGEYDYMDARVTIEPSGRIVRKDGWSLAGSSATMLDCINWLGALGCLTEAQLWRVGRDNALQLLGASMAESALRKAPTLRIRREGTRVAFAQS